MSYNNALLSGNTSFARQVSASTKRGQPQPAKGRTTLHVQAIAEAERVVSPTTSANKVSYFFRLQRRDSTSVLNLVHTKICALAGRCAGRNTGYSAPGESGRSRYTLEVRQSTGLASAEIVDS